MWVLGFMLRISTVILCSTGMMLPAMAFPPDKVLPFARPTAAQSTRINLENHASVGSGGSHAASLDLRLPLAGELMASTAGRSHLDTSSAGEETRRLSLGHRNARNEDRNSIAGFAVPAGQTREMSGVEAFARRFHREGLPLARLWENHSALVSLGLNQKGKPGLWLVQKTR